MKKGRQGQSIATVDATAVERAREDILSAIEGTSLSAAVVQTSYVHFYLILLVILLIKELIAMIPPEHFLYVPPKGKRPYAKVQHKDHPIIKCFLIPPTLRIFPCPPLALSPNFRRRFGL